MQLDTTDPRRLRVRDDERKWVRAMGVVFTVSGLLALLNLPHGLLAGAVFAPLGLAIYFVFGADRETLLDKETGLLTETMRIPVGGWVFTETTPLAHVDRARVRLTHDSDGDEQHELVLDLLDGRVLTLGLVGRPDICSSPSEEVNRWLALSSPPGGAVMAPPLIRR